MNANLQTVDVVVPVFDEETSLAHNVEPLARLPARASSRSASRIVIADNASNDDTPAIASMLAASHPEVTALRLERKGRGHALRTRLAHVGGRHRLVHGRRPLDEPRELPAARRTAHLRAQRARDRHPPRASARTCAAGSSARCFRAATTSRPRRLPRAASPTRSAASRRCGPTSPGSSCRSCDDDGWFFDTELLLLAERNGMRIHEVPVDWIEDLDSRVDLLPTIGGDLRRPLARSTCVLARRGARPAVVAQ